MTLSKQQNIFQSSSLVDFVSPESRTRLNITVLLCRCKLNFLHQTDIILKPDELIDYEVFEGFQHIVAEGLI